MRWRIGSASWFPKSAKPPTHSIRRSGVGRAGVRWVCAVRPVRLVVSCRGGKRFRGGLGAGPGCRRVPSLVSGRWGSAVPLRNVHRCWLPARRSRLVLLRGVGHARWAPGESVGGRAGVSSRRISPRGPATTDNADLATFTCHSAASRSQADVFPAGVTIPTFCAQNWQPSTARKPGRRNVVGHQKRRHADRYADLATFAGAQGCARPESARHGRAGHSPCPAL